MYTMTKNAPENAEEAAYVLRAIAYALTALGWFVMGFVIGLAWSAT